MKGFLSALVVTVTIGLIAWDKLTAAPGQAVLDFVINRMVSANVQPGPAPSPVIKSEPLGIPELKEIAELSTFSYKSSVISTAEQKTNLPLVGEQTTASLVMQITAVIKVGVDVNGLTDKLVVNGNTVEVVLPRAKILSISPDEEKSRVVSSVEVRPAPELQQQARQDAERQFRADVCNSDVLQKAEQLAVGAVYRLFKAANPTREFVVKVESKEQLCQ